MAIKDWPGGVISKTPVVPAGSYNNSAASGVWTLDQVAYWQKQGIWPNPANVVDPYFYDVTLLLTGDGTNGAQNNTFLDSSSNNFTITRNGNTTQGTFSPYGNLWSNYFGAVGQYLTPSGTPSAIVGTLNGSTNLCIECWIFPTAYNTTQYPAIIGDMSPTTEADYWSFGINASGQVTMYWYTGTGVVCYSTSAVTLNTWSHIAVNINAGAITLYINGVSQTLNGTTTLGTVAGSVGYLIIGQWNNGGAGNSGRFVGYISNLRVTKASVYTSSFTPSTTPLTAVSGTSLLTCQSNRFIDNSSNNFTLTVNGNTSVQRFSPFNPTSAYGAATIGGSGYFDGTGDYLNTPATGQFAPTGDFTIGVWFYPLALATYNEVIGNYTGNVSTDWLFEIAANGALAFYTNGAAIRIQSAAGAIKIGQWHYLALCRSGTTITGYINGTSVGTYTQSGTFGSASKTIYIGSQAGSYLINGYLSDVKLINGSAVTTVPTAPMTATTGTNLLLNFTNAGIPDAAMMNDLETVGNAQVSTSVVKYGTGSLAFDGTGDYLYKGVANYTTNFGTGAFTIEAWVYPTATGVQCICDTRLTDASSTGVYFGLYSSNQLLLFTNNTVTSGGTVSTNTWSHVAIVKNGTTITLYINGSSVATVSNSANLTDGNCQIGASTTVSGSSANYWNGYIDDLRITKGYARYTTNFTPPTAAFPTL